MSWNSSALRANDPSSWSSAGSSSSVASASAARCTAEGNTSLEDWPMLTWSLGWASSPARFAITSLAFMFDDVPEPVWKTSIGNWSSNSPSATRSAARAMRSATSPSSFPSSAFTRAAAALIRPSQRTTGTGTGAPEIGKLATALVVSPPHSCSFSLTPMALTLATEGDQLARDPDRVVVGNQEARPRERAQLSIGEQCQRFSRGLDTVLGPQQQHRHIEPGVGVEQLRLRRSRPATRELRPRAGEVAVAAYICERMPDEVSGGWVLLRGEPLAELGAEHERGGARYQAVEPGDRPRLTRSPPRRALERV